MAGDVFGGEVKTTELSSPFIDIPCTLIHFAISSNLKHTVVHDFIGAVNPVFHEEYKFTTLHCFGSAFWPMHELGWPGTTLGPQW